MKGALFLRLAATATISPVQVNLCFFLKQERLVTQFHCLQDNDTVK